MSLYQFNGISPSLGGKVFIANSAEVIGNVVIAEDANIWFQCVLRGDINSIQIGERTNIQDLSVLHVTAENSLFVGSGVTVGHNVTLHACRVENNCLIGMGAIILDGAIIGENSLVAAGSVVPPGKIYPPGSFIIGNPAVVKRSLSDEERKIYGQHHASYLALKEEYLNQLKFKRL